MHTIVDILITNIILKSAMEIPEYKLCIINMYSGTTTYLLIYVSMAIINLCKYDLLNVHGKIYFRQNNTDP